MGYIRFMPYKPFRRLTKKEIYERYRDMEAGMLKYGMRFSRPASPSSSTPAPPQPSPAPVTAFTGKAP
jgi:hypothetical protein